MTLAITDILAALEALHIEIRWLKNDEEIESSFCRLKDRQILYLRANENITRLTHLIRQHIPVASWENIYLKPALREFFVGEK